MERLAGGAGAREPRDPTVACRRRHCGSPPNARSSFRRCSSRQRGAGRHPAWPAGGPGTGDPGRTGSAAGSGSRTTSAPHWRHWRSRASQCAAASRRASNAEEWCDRRLLARIHHYTVRRLRAEIEPVAARDFLRFLFDWQRVTDEARLEGPDAISAAVALLEGFEAPAGAWETEILPARITGYEPTWLDDMCLAGRIAWARLTPGAKAQARRYARRRSRCWHADTSRSGLR